MKPAKPFSAWMDRATARRAAGSPWPATLGRSQVFILPTRFGWLAAAATLAMLLVALNYQNSPAFLLAFLLGALVLVAMVACHRHLRGLVILAATAEPAWAGEPIRLRLEVANRGRGVRRGLACFAGAGSGGETTVAPGMTSSLSLILPPRRRGRYPIRQVGLATSEPFGVFRAWSRLTAIECIVYPRPAPAAPPPPGTQGIARDSTANDQPVDFVGLARYRPGDRPSQIAWPAYAHTGALERKRFGGGGGGANWLDFAAAPGTDAEVRLSILASWALAAERGGKPWGLRLPGHVLAPARGAVHLARCLRALALYPGPYDDEN